MARAIDNYTLGDCEVSKFDASTLAVNTIEYEHHEIHAGSHFILTGFATLANDASLDFRFTTPNTTKWAHLLFKVSGPSQTELLIYEGGNVTVGTPVTPINSNRNSTKTSVMTLASGPTVTTTGTLIYSQSAGLAGTTPARAPSEGFVTRGSELILKQNTTYLFRITSRQADNIVSYDGEWYEHTDKN